LQDHFNSYLSHFICTIKAVNLLDLTDAQDSSFKLFTVQDLSIST